MRLTAEQARKIAGPTIDEYVDKALEKIQKEAENKRRFVNLTDDFWTNGGYDQTPEWLEAKKQLELLGYKVEFFYEVRQFVNMFTIVQW